MLLETRKRAHSLQVATVREGLRRAVGRLPFRPGDPPGLRLEAQGLGDVCPGWWRSGRGHAVAWSGPRPVESEGSISGGAAERMRSRDGHGRVLPGTQAISRRGAPWARSRLVIDGRGAAVTDRPARRPAPAGRVRPDRLPYRGGRRRGRTRTRRMSRPTGGSARDAVVGVARRGRCGRGGIRCFPGWSATWVVRGRPGRGEATPEPVPTRSTCCSSTIPTGSRATHRPTGVVARVRPASQLERQHGEVLFTRALPVPGLSAPTRGDDVLNLLDGGRGCGRTAAGHLRQPRVRQGRAKHARSSRPASTRARSLGRVEHDWADGEEER